MQIKDVVSFLETIAPSALQEDYDNSGLLCGDVTAEVKGALICLDVTNEVIDEALQHNCNLIISHHPLVFSGLKRFTGKTFVDRLLVKAIKNDVALLSVHTNLDNVPEGVNAMICDKLGLKNYRILQQKRNQLRKLVTFCPNDDDIPEKVRNALFDAGAGFIGKYDRCSYNQKGTGTFRPTEEADPYSGEIGKMEFADETRIEVLFPKFKQAQIVKALFGAHPYEEVAYDVYELENMWQEAGSGMIGELENEMGSGEFLRLLKENFKTQCIRHTQPVGKTIKKVAVCGGSGSFLLKDAISAGADVLVTADFKYHQFFDADGMIMIADIGHYESEQFTIELLYEVLTKKFNNFALRKTSVNTNPINYF